MPTRILATALPALDPTLIEAWAGVPTTIAADLFPGRVLVDPAIRPIRPLGVAGKLVGTAITAWCEPGDYGPVHHAIEMAAAGQVIVVAAAGRLDAAMIGELLCGAARRKGLAGVAVDGAVRDIATLAAWPDFPVFARGCTARGPASMERGSVNEPVVFGGVRVAPGDLIIGDDDGLVAIAAADLAAGLPQAQAMVRAEAEWRARLEQGASTIEVFKVPAAQRL